mmetsp:Transcript_55215/g.108008  ORF Transcript_55215/g.108008 Transcript_55215/m.108008 type:complete len:97 (+) Transcript_55215:197-487(+)
MNLKELIEFVEGISIRLEERPTHYPTVRFLNRRLPLSVRPSVFTTINDWKFFWRTDRLSLLSYCLRACPSVHLSALALACPFLLDSARDEEEKEEQ